MTATSASSKTLPAWQGCIRAISSFQPLSVVSRPDRIELGRAVFLLPEPGAAKTTSWARADGQFCIFTGFLYNRRELLEELGCRQPSPSPAQLVLAGYARWNCDLLDKLEGAFAWAIWDRTNESLLCSRDPVGLHPFYYSVVGEELVFSWDLHAVCRHPRVSLDLNRVVLAEHLTHHLLDAHETFFTAVRRLPGGHALKFTPGGLEVFRYWNALPTGQPIRWATLEELTEFPRLLAKSVEKVMECGNGHTGIFLSGGLDSVSVAACAAEIASRLGWSPPKALSVIFPDPGSEEGAQTEVARNLGFPQNLAYIQEYTKAPGLLRRALDLGAGYPAPVAFVFAPPFADLLKRAASAGCEVVMTGDGGDELLTVTPAHCADLIASGRWRDFAGMLQTLWRYWEGSLARSLRSGVWTWGFRLILRDWAWRHVPGLAMFRRRQLIEKAYPSWVAPDPRLRRELLSRYEQRWDRLNVQGSFYLAYADDSLVAPGFNMVFEEQFYRYTPLGLATLHPWWNRPLADLLLRTPPEVLYNGNQSKSLIRSRVAAQFPHLGFQTQKKTPVTDFSEEVFRRELPGLWRQLGRPRMMAELDLVDPDAYQATMARRCESDKAAHLYEVWHGATIEDWLRLRS